MVPYVLVEGSLCYGGGTLYIMVDKLMLLGLYLMYSVGRYVVLWEVVPQILLGGTLSYGVLVPKLREWYHKLCGVLLYVWVCGTFLSFVFNLSIE